MSEREQPTGPEWSENESEPSDAERRETEPRLRPRIWVGSLADYNAGRLHGGPVSLIWPHCDGLIWPHLRHAGAWL